METYDKSMEMIKKSTSKVAMGHLELSGFYMFRGIKNDSGLDKSIFKKFKQVYTGHYHTRSDDGKILPPRLYAKSRTVLR